MSALIGKIVRLILVNNFHYNGKVINETDDTLTLIDQKGAEVQLTKSSIMVQEVNN